MKCSYCSREFNESDAAASCLGCGKRTGCGMIKCPFCGYETPRETKWIKSIKKFFDKE